MLSKHSLAVATTLSKQINVSLEHSHNLFSDSIRYSLPIFPRKGISLEDAAGEVGQASQVVIESNGMSQHEGAVNNAVETLLIGVTNQFDYVRNTVRPFISTAVDRLINRLKSSTPSEYTVKEFEISEFLVSDVAQRIFKDVPPVRYYKVAKEGTAKEASQILQDISTNIPDIDAAVGKIVADCGEQTVVDIYNAIFRDIRPQNETESTDLVRRLVMRSNDGLTLGLYSLDEVDFLLLAYFVAEGYLDNPIDGTGLSLDEYQTYIRQTMLNIGGSIHRLVAQYQNDVEKGVLYLRKPQAAGIFFDDRLGQILVLKPIFRLGLEKGLVAEQVIGGAIHPSKKLFKLSDVLPLAQECFNVYRAMDKHRQQQTRLTLIDRINDSMRIVLNEGLDDLPADKFPADFNREAAVGNIGKVTEFLKAYFAEWDSSEELRIYDLVTRIICKLVFPFTDALMILETMEQVVAEEEIEPRHAAYYAEIIYIARWMVANFHIAKDEE
jgi:hypothetical protein